jgi:hypothetical protein
VDLLLVGTCRALQPWCLDLPDAVRLETLGRPHPRLAELEGETGPGIERHCIAVPAAKFAVLVREPGSSSSPRNFSVLCSVGVTSNM